MAKNIRGRAGAAALCAALSGCGGGEADSKNTASEGGAPSGNAGESALAGANADAGGGSPHGGSGSDTPLPVTCGPPAAGLPGELDPSFEHGHKNVPGNFAAKSIELDRHGRLLVTGEATFAQSTFRLARFTREGAYDAEFSGDGVVSLALGGAQYEHSQFATADAQDRVWVGGSISIPSSDPTSALLVRLNDDGSLDTSFNASGSIPGALVYRPRELHENLLNEDAQVHDIVAADGGAWVRSEPVSALERVLDDGTLDPDFQPQNVGSGPMLWAYGSLFIPGTAVYAFGPDGSPRSEFGSDGVLELERPPITATRVFRSQYIAAQPPDKLLLVEYRSRPSYVARITRDGQLDTSFGVDGFSLPTECNIKAVATVCDGLIVLAGELDGSTAAAQYCALVLTPEGQPIEGTPEGGMFTWPQQDAAINDGGVWDVAIEPDTGSMVFMTYDVHLTRINLPYQSP